MDQRLSNVAFLRLGPEHAESAYRLHRQVLTEVGAHWLRPQSRSFFRRRCAGEAGFIVGAVYEETIIGTAALDERARWPERSMVSPPAMQAIHGCIDSGIPIGEGTAVAVHPDFRRLGLAARLQRLRWDTAVAGGCGGLLGSSHVHNRASILSAPRGAKVFGVKLDDDGPDLWWVQPVDAVSARFEPVRRVAGYPVSAVDSIGNSLQAGCVGIIAANASAEPQLDMYSISSSRPEMCVCAAH